MKRFFLPLGFLIASLALSRSTSAQFQPNIWGANRAGELDVQKLRSEQTARLKKYAAPVKPKVAPKPPALNRGAPGPYGRVDLSGRPVPGYAAIRDHGATFLGPPQRRVSRSPAPNVYTPRLKAHPRATGTRRPSR